MTAIPLMDLLAMDCLPAPLPHSPGYRASAQGSTWELIVDLEVIPDLLCWRVSAEYTELQHTLFWSGGLISNEKEEWHQMKEELATRWVQRAMDMEADGLSDAETVY